MGTGLQTSNNNRGLSADIKSLVLATPTTNAPRRIKRLTIVHRRMIALHLQGRSYKEIAEIVGRRPSTVAAVLRNPASQDIIERACNEHDGNLKALLPLTALVVKRGLLDPDVEVGLKATDQLYRMLGRYREQEKASQSAEDVIRRIITLRNGDQEVTIAEERR